MGTRIIHFLVKYILFPFMAFYDWVAGLITEYPKQFCVFLFAAVLLIAVIAVVLIKKTITRLSNQDYSGSGKGTGIWVGILLLFIAGIIVVVALRYLDKIDIREKKQEVTALATESVTETETEILTDEIMSSPQDFAEAETIAETEPETESETAQKTREEFLTDFKASYDRREAVYGQYAGARRETMSAEAWNTYLETCVEAERDFYEKYQDASFEDLNIQYLCNQYVDGLRKQYQAVEEWKKDPNSENGDLVWLSGYYDRAGVIVEMSEYYDINIPERTVATLTAELDSMSEPETGNAEVDPETVLRTQELLNAIGFYCGNADGVAGKNTVKLIRRFQEMYGYDPADGLIDDELVEQLEEAYEQKTGRKPAKRR